MLCHRAASCQAHLSGRRAILQAVAAADGGWNGESNSVVADRLPAEDVWRPDRLALIVCPYMVCHDSDPRPVMSAGCDICLKLLPVRRTYIYKRAGYIDEIDKVFSVRKLRITPRMCRGACSRGLLPRSGRHGCAVAPRRDQARQQAFCKSTRRFCSWRCLFGSIDHFLRWSNAPMALAVAQGRSTRRGWNCGATGAEDAALRLDPDYRVRFGSSRPGP